MRALDARPVCFARRRSVEQLRGRRAAASCALAAAERAVTAARDPFSASKRPVRAMYPGTRFKRRKSTLFTCGAERSEACLFVYQLKEAPVAAVWQLFAFGREVGSDGSGSPRDPARQCSGRGWSYGKTSGLWSRRGGRVDDSPGGVNGGGEGSRRVAHRCRP